MQAVMVSFLLIVLEQLGVGSPDGQSLSFFSTEAKILKNYFLFSFLIVAKALSVAD